MPSRPRSETELLQRARALAGRSLKEVASTLGLNVPPDLRRAKGWVGELIERALGAIAGSKPEPDFAELGVEVKSIPIGADGRPRESTHVCAIAMGDAAGACWEKSLARRKLARVLWVPVEASPAIALAARRIGQAVLWSPSPEQEEQLRRDWEELMELIALGRAGEVRGEMGVCLQVRPKAASGSARTRASNSEGEMNAGLPLGFYLRATFTAQILASHYADLPAPGHD
jgi:DNA mismatch repair protein MutH